MRASILRLSATAFLACSLTLMGCGGDEEKEQDNTENPDNGGNDGDGDGQGDGSGDGNGDGSGDGNGDGNGNGDGDGDGNGDGTNQVPAELAAFCQSYSEKTCALLVHCGMIGNGQSALCQEVLRDECEAEAFLVAKGTKTLDMTATVACLQELDAANATAASAETCFEPAACSEVLKVDGQAGEPCDSSEQCVAGLYCGAGTGACGACAPKVADGQPCNWEIKDQCDSGYCNADSLTNQGKVDTCGIKSIGDACGVPDDCPPTTYCKGWQLSADQTSVTPGVCATQEVAGAACAGEPGACVSGTTCLNSTCVEDGSVAENGACESSRHCATDLSCNNKVCIPKKSLAAGADCSAADQCTGDLTCFEGKCFQPGSIAVGGACTSSMQCVEGSSCGANDTCVANESVAADGDCTRDEQCAAGLLCLFGSSKCQAPLAAGQACEPFLLQFGIDECAAGLRCAPVSTDAYACVTGPELSLAEGQECVALDECKSLLACTPGSNGKKACTSMALVDRGAACSAAAGTFCRDGYCDNGTCAAFVDAGAACTDHAQCESNACLDAQGGTDGARTCIEACF